MQLSRSEVVQTLTMFIAFLDWIRPTDSNAEVHHKLKKVVKRIIDIVFDPPNSHSNAHSNANSNSSHPPPSQHPHPQPADVLRCPPAQQQIITPPMDQLHGFDPSVLLLDDLDWLNGVDWTDGHW